VRPRWSEGSPLAGVRIMGSGWRCPQIGAHAIQVVHDLSIFNGELAK
jgi:hypothetical protein